MATVVVGGLMSATLLTLVLLPALYYLVESKLARPAQAPSDDPANAR
ncbi:hypothetical protein [Salmonella enterica]